jgi:hypothetical protein
MSQGSGKKVTGGGTEAEALRVTLANDSTGVVSVDDNGASLTVDGTFWQATQPVSLALVPTHDVTNAGTFAVQATQSGTWNVADGGGSLTVDGSVTVSGSVTADTELPTAAALADNTANPTAPAVGAFGMLWDGITWDRVPGSSLDGLLVNMGTNNDVTISGSVAVTGTFWQGTQPVSIASAVAVTQSTASSLKAQVQIIDSVGDSAMDDANNALRVNIVAGASSGTQYTEGDTDASITGTALMLEGAANTLIAAPGTAADGLLVNLGSNNDVAVTGAVSIVGTTTVSGSGTFTVGDGGSTLSIDDNGSSISVDAPVADPVYVRLSDGATAISTLPVSLASVPSHAVTNAGTFAVQAAQSGTWNVGTLATITNPVAVTGTFYQATQPVSIAASVPVTDNSGSLTVDAPVATPVFVRLSDGSNAIATLPVSLASEPGNFAEDAAHTTGDIGRHVLAVRNDSGVPTVSADGDYVSLQTDEHGALRVQAFGPGTVDSFGNVVTGSVNNQIDVQFYRDTPANLTTVTTASGGTATATGGMATFAATSTASSSAKGVSLTTTTYTAGAGVYTIFTAAFTGTGSGTSYQRIGLYGADSGLRIGFEAGTFGITRRTGAVDVETVAKASFNLDPLTGGARSNFTRAGVPEAINLTKLNVWRIRFGWVGSAPIEFDVLSPDGQWVMFHQIRQPNNSATPSMATADLSFTCEVNSGNSGQALSILTNCWCAGTTQALAKINSTLTANSLAQLARSVIVGETTGGGGGFVNVKVAPSGAITADVTGTVAATQSGTWNVGTVTAVTAITNALPTGTNDIGGVTARPVFARVATQTSSLTTATTAYVAGDQVGTLLTMSNCARTSGGSGLIVGCTLTDAADIIGAYDVLIFDSSVTASGGDNGALSFSDSDMRKFVGLIQLGGAFDVGGNRIAQAHSIAMPFVCSGSANLYALLVCRAGHTFFAANADLELVLYVERA